jgi:hypothetical protein
MPISIRKTGQTFSAAGYRFPQAQEKDVVEDWPWLRRPGSDTQLCDVCSQLNFTWLFQESLAGCTVTDAGITSQLSDGIYLGLHADVSRRKCPFCQLLVYALEEGADIDMMNEYDEWPCQELWLRNHSLSTSGRVINFQNLKNEHIVRLDVRLKPAGEDNVMFSSWGPGARTVMIQKIRTDPISGPMQIHEGRVVDQDTDTLMQTIRQWIHPCLDSTVRGLSSPETASIRLIDTMDACIVGPMRDKRYVALRYEAIRLFPALSIDMSHQLHMGKNRSTRSSEAE